MKENLLIGKKQDGRIVRFVARDYLMSIKEAWKNLKGTDVSNHMSAFICMSVWFGPGNGDKRDAYIICITMMSIMALGHLISRMYPNRLEKTLLLCPLTTQEKMRYLKTGYYLRIALPMAVYLPAGAIWLILGMASRLHVAWIGIWVFLHLGCANIYCRPDTGKDAMTRIYPIYRLEYAYVAAMLLAGLEVVGMSFFFREEPSRAVVYGYGGIVTILHALLFVIMRRKFYPQIMERAMLYENIY